MTGINSSLSYQYDTLNQVTSATKPTGTGTESFTYDILGNKLKSEGETVNSSFNDHNQLTNDKKFSYIYDKNGNLTTRTNLTTNKVTEYAWDYENRLIGVKEKDSADSLVATKTISYRYDPFGRRIQKDVDGTVTKYIYDRDNILLELNSQNALLAKYVHGVDVDQPLRMERSTSPYSDESLSEQYFYYHRDRLGNITEITDRMGNVVQRYVYDAFGGITIYDNQNNVITPTSSKYLKNPFTFTGREYDPETGLYYYRARYYHPETGRFLSEDPIMFDGGDENLYRYVRNNPLNFTDPSGKTVVALPWSIPIIDTVIITGIIIISACLRESQKEKEKRCLGEYNDDVQTCIGRHPRGQLRSACIESAGDRYSECLRTGESYSPLSP